MKSAVRRTLLLSVAFGLAGLLVPGPAAGRSGTIAVPRVRVVLKPFSLEVQITADHWQKDIHIPERWGPELRLEEKKAVHFRFKQRTDAPATVFYQVFKGRLPRTGEIARPVASGSLGKPPGKNKTREFDVDFTKFLPAAPDGKDYHVRLLGSAAGGGTSVCSNAVKISYKRQDVTQFPTPTLKRVIGTADAHGNELRWDQKPLAVGSQIFRVEGTDLYEVPAETVVQFLKGSQVVKEVHPVPAQTHKLPSGEVSLAVTTPWLAAALYNVRVKTGWGVTGQLPLYVAGKEDADHQFVGYVSNEESRFVDYVGGFRDEFKGTWTSTQYYWGEARFLGADHLTFADSADLAYIAGHGSPSYIKMSADQGCLLEETALGSHSTLDHKGDLEYIVFHSCSVLAMVDARDMSWRERWAHTYATRNDPRPFSGLHIAMGFRTTHHNGAGAGWWAADEFAENLEEGCYSVRYSWYEAAEDARWLAGWTDNKPAVFYLRPHRYEKASQHNSTDYKYGDADYLLDAYYMK